MDKGWGLPNRWWSTGSPLETPANPPDGTKDICTGVPLDYLKQAGFGGNLVGTVVISEVPEQGAEG